jgi:son of sevenless-like protein
MTFKSFTTVEELTELLIERFRIQPPEGLTPAELDEWSKLKQKVIQIRYVVCCKFYPGSSLPTRLF